MADDGQPERARANKEWGAKFAHLLLTMPHSHQLGVCAELRIPSTTHTRWMSTQAEPGSDVAEYQAEVLTALAKQRADDLDAIDVAIETVETGKASVLWNVRKHRHESRFKRFYDDATSQKVELTGKDGGPIETSAVRYVVAMPQEEPEEDDEE